MGAGSARTARSAWFDVSWRVPESEIREDQQRYRDGQSRDEDALAQELHRDEYRADEYHSVEGRAEYLVYWVRHTRNWAGSRISLGANQLG